MASTDTVYMSDLVKGSQAATGSLSNWTATGTTVVNESGTYYYAIAASGNMQQNLVLPSGIDQAKVVELKLKYRIQHDFDTLYKDTIASVMLVLTYADGTIDTLAFPLTNKVTYSNENDQTWIESFLDYSLKQNTTLVSGMLTIVDTDATIPIHLQYISVLPGYPTSTQIQAIQDALTSQGAIDFTTLQANFAAIAAGLWGYADAQFINANAIKAGSINTAIIDILGNGGRLLLHNNRIQVFDANETGELFERISIGDINGDGTLYGIRVRGSDGTTELFNENGLTKEGITDGWNKTEEGSIDGKKLDIETVVTSINDGTTTINSAKIQAGAQTLDVALSTMNQTIGGKASQQDINNAIANMKIGIKNLIIDSAFMVDDEAYQLTAWSAFNTTYTDLLVNEFQGKNVLKTDYTVGASTSRIDVTQIVVNIKPNTVYTFSAYLKGTANIYFVEQKVDGTNTATYKDNYHQLVNENNYQLFTFSFTTQSDTAQVKFYFGVPGTHAAEITMIMLVESSKSVDWMPAPEDIYAQFSTQQAEIQANSDAISMTVSSDNYSSDLAQTQGDISDLQDGLSSANDGIGGANSRLDVINSQLSDMPTNDDMNAAIGTVTSLATSAKEEADNLSVTVQQIYQGGTNRLENSSGLNDTAGWTVTGTVTIDTIKSGEIAAGKCFSLGSNASISQPMVLAANIEYTITLKALKTSTGAAAKVLVIDGDNTFEVLNELGAITSWSNYSFSFTPAHANCTIIISNITAKFSIADIMIAEGAIKTKWSPAFNEIYIETVRIDSSGVTVSNNDDNPDNQFSTHMGTSSFSIQHQGTTVIQVDGDMALLNSANVQGALQIANIQFLPRTDGSGKVDLVYLG